MRFSYKAIVVSVVAAIAGYGIWLLATDSGDGLKAITQFSPWLVLWVSLLSIANYLLRFFRWQGFLRQGDYAVPPLKSLGYYLAGFALTTTPGKAGEAVRSLYLEKHQVPVTNSLAMLVVERVQDLLAVLLLASFAILRFPEYAAFGYAALVLLSGLIFLMLSQKCQHLAEKIINRIPISWVNRLGFRVLDILKQSNQLLGPVRLLQGLLIGIIAWGLEALALGIIVEATGNTIDYSLAAGIYALAMLAGALSFLPGGLGSAEAVMYGLLLASGVDSANATAATLISRLTTLWLAVVIGLITLLIIHGKLPQIIRRKSYE
ncbi:lysylphosphatidylglycerol synthase transmembrane domain-containing protein [Pelagibaculum spongiae]|uniref:lysylphosphatidylglycerol synthase transmembrane domain-containing protein n=1 Tax=Pelagibaculum spongiae TaxID=2080658 RepID=UPI001314F879|nr:lysylphosphatidylglycerol synthase transmembrane domain-containing protein [Pelagibaculum spongiae]